MASKVYIDEEDLETYIRSDLYGVFDKVRSVMVSLILCTVYFFERGGTICRDYVCNATSIYSHHSDNHPAGLR